MKKEGFDKKTESDYLDRGRANLESLYTEITGQSYGELSLEYDFRSAYGGVFLPTLQRGVSEEFVQSIAREQGDFDSENTEQNPQSSTSADNSLRQEP